jgi:hypothetical protein
VTPLRTNDVAKAGSFVRSSPTNAQFRGTSQVLRLAALEVGVNRACAMRGEVPVVPITVPVGQRTVSLSEADRPTWLPSKIRLSAKRPFFESAFSQARRPNPVFSERALIA